jgi:hypothetical protein
MDNPSDAQFIFLPKIEKRWGKLDKIGEISGSDESL